MKMKAKKSENDSLNRTSALMTELQEKQEKVLDSLGSLAKKIFFLIRLYGVDAFDFKTENEKRVANGIKSVQLER